MPEPSLSLRSEAATADINQHPVQIREIDIDQAHDTFGHLPVELISHIFTIYAENFRVHSSFNRVRFPPEPGPLLLGAVSKLWREVAFGMPQLWNTINIQIRLLPSALKTNTKIVELVQQWLDRSGQLLLYISVKVKAVGTKHLWEPIFSLIRNCAPRWHTLVLGATSEMYAAFLNGLTCAPNLHTLNLINLADLLSEEDSSDHDDPFHLQTPSLKYLDVFDLRISSLAVHWGNITHFESDGVSVDEFFEVLRLAGRMASCTLLYLTDGWDLYPVPSTPLIHSALKQLHLGANDGRLDGFPELDLLVFPSLEKLGYEYHRKYSFPLHRLISLVNQSCCQLTHFELRSGELSEDDVDDLISLFSALPTLTHLKLEDLADLTFGSVLGGTMTDKLLLKLTPIEGVQAELLPCLQSLEFRGIQKFSWNCLADFIIARLLEDSTGSNSPIADIDRNLSVLQRNRNSIRFVSFIVRKCEPIIDLDTRARFNHARDIGVSVEIVDGFSNKLL